MRTPRFLAFLCLLVCLSLSCNAVQPASVSAGRMEFAPPSQPDQPAVSPTIPPAPSSTLTPTNAPPTPTGTPTITHTPTETYTPSLEPDAWKSMPVIPSGVSDATRAIFLNGRRLGNDPHAFSILGDCLSLRMFGNYGKGPKHYNLGGYKNLQPVIDQFLESFNRRSVTLGDGFNTAAVLSPLRADPKRCEKDESPLVCEYRIHQPAYALISLGTDDHRTKPESYEERMRVIIEYTIANGTVPILATKADNREGNHEFNKIVARLAHEYDIPLWNFWAALQSLPQKGLADNVGHLTWGDPNRLDAKYSMYVAVPVRAVTALQTLEVLWLGLVSE